MNNRISKYIILTAIILFSFNSRALCEEVAGEALTKKAKTPESDVSAIFVQNDAKIKSIQNSISEIKGKMDELGQTVKDIKAEIKSLQEKTLQSDNSIMEELNRYNEQIKTIDTNYSQQSKKVSALEGDFKDIKDILKMRVDKMQSWDDILDVLKKEISNNEIEIARLKKDINELKKQYGYSDNIFNSIAMWPYTGVTALIVSLVAFIVVLVKQ